MVRDIVNSFDYMGLCSVLNLTTACTDGKWAVIWPPNFTTKYVSLLSHFTMGSKYVLPAKTVNF